jgi:superfamily II DNA or RNA helicase/HKD family nuclease
MDKLPEGLYELLHTKGLHELLEQEHKLGDCRWMPVDPQMLHHYIALPIARRLASLIEQGKISLDHMNTEAVMKVIEQMTPVELKVLSQIRPVPPSPVIESRPDTPLAASALLTGSSRTPSLHSQLIKELDSCERSDWLVSFIKFSAVRQLLPQLQKFTQTAAPDGGPRLRIATTSYMGATDSKALKLLMELPNTEIRISYDTNRTRLHAKAYLFYRSSGFSSAYIGSANMSRSALNEGLEWTAKISEFENPHLWEHAKATFNSHWEDEQEFFPCTETEFEHVASLLRRAAEDTNHIIPLFDLRPYGFQQIILEQIAAERSAGKCRHLVISATGTGKTMVAGFDYRNYSSGRKQRPSLLYLAHRHDILEKARMSFRQILGDLSFGELLGGGQEPSTYEYLFCTVASWNSRSLSSVDPAFYEYVVLDEAHHGKADTYQRIIDHIRPKVLLGLTATPERTDNQDIRDDFEGAFTHEIRLPEAVDRGLLSAFHYYGIPDHQDIDYRHLSWKRGFYDVEQLHDLLSANRQRAQWVLSQTSDHVADTTSMRALGFCVSVRHAEFMAEVFQEYGLKAAAVTSKISHELRRELVHQLVSRKLNILFTVDLFNEGIDIPQIDTILFLRPTQSLTLFLQQFGRGLRLHPDKEHLTVLDFIAPHKDDFDLVSRYRALTTLPGKRIDEQIQNGMPFVPAGCALQLEQQAQAYVLDHISRASARIRGRKIEHEIRKLKSMHGQDRITLKQVLDYFHLDNPDPIYRRGLICELTGECPDISDLQLHKGLRRLLLADDTQLLEQAIEMFRSERYTDEKTAVLIHSLLWSRPKRAGTSLEQAHHLITSLKPVLNDLLDLLRWMISSRTPTVPQKIPGCGPLNLHASYTREQILLMLGKGSFNSPFTHREGVLHIPEKKFDIFFADIRKSEQDFSPTTMYKDYAVTRRLFHWQSMSTTSVGSATGQRYIHHQDMGYTPLLFIRERKQAENGLTAPFVFAGPLTYERHEGSSPISVTWKLANPLPESIFSWARQAG